MADDLNQPFLPPVSSGSFSNDHPVSEPIPVSRSSDHTEHSAQAKVFVSSVGQSYSSNAIRRDVGPQVPF